MLIYLLFACKEEPKPKNIAPEVTIFFPDEAGSGSFEEGDLVLFSARIEDSDEAILTNIEVQWLLDEAEEAVCPFYPMDEKGESSCELTLLPELTKITAMAKDSKGDVGLDSYELNITPNAKPQIEIINLSSQEIYAGNIPFSIAANIIDENDLMSDVIVSWTSDIVGDLDISNHPSSTGLFSAQISLPEGIHTLTATATDHLGADSSDTIQITAGASGIPVLDSIGIADQFGVFLAEAFDGQTITCIVGTTNPYSLPLSYAIQWFNQSGEELTVDPNSTQLTLDFATQNLSDGEDLTCLATIYTEHTRLEASTTIPLSACNPFSTEIPYDGVDSNCDGLEYLNDQNRDGQPDDSSQDYNDRDLNTARLGVECYGELQMSSESTVYYLICDNAQYWKNAQRFCVENGYDSLATLHLNSEFQALAGMLESSMGYTDSAGAARSGEIWLGFTRGPDCFPTNNENVTGFPSICSSKPADYYWVDNGPRSYLNATHWWSGEGTPAGEHCGELKREGGEVGLWDLYCDTTGMAPHHIWAPDHIRPSTCMIRVD